MPYKQKLQGVSVTTTTIAVWAPPKSPPANIQLRILSPVLTP